MQPIIEVKNLVRTFGGKTAVNNVSFNVEKGSFHALLGHNGAGKTTIIKTIIGASPIYDGDILINGKDIKVEKTSIGYIPEHTNFPSMKCIEFANVMANFSAVKNSKSKIDELFEVLGIAHLKHSKLSNLSSGEKKKMMILQVLLDDPEIIVADEPAANLDPIARKELMEVLHRLNKNGKTILITSHILEEIKGYVNVATIIKHGQVAFSGAIKLEQELIDKYNEIHAAEIIDQDKLSKFLGDKNE